MTATEIARARFRAQRLDPPVTTAPAELVRWLGAVQAQDFGLSRWSIGQRTCCDAKAVDAALANGSILRTHVLRPTWHYVTREDIGWMLALTAERIRARLRPYDRQNGVDVEMIRTSRRAMEAAIRKSGHLTRARIAEILGRRGIRVDAGWIVGHLLLHAELSGTICSGIAQGAQQTYALLEERAPLAAMLMGDDALAELATRYFQSHSPASPQDFRWWSGLGAAEASRAIEAIRTSLDECDTVDGRRFLVHRNATKRVTGSRQKRAHLLQAFDELVVAYSRTRSIVDERGLLVNTKPEGLLTRSVVLDGQVCGRWEKQPRPDRLAVRVRLAVEVGPRGRLSIARAVDEYGRFFGQTASATFAGADELRRGRGLRSTAAEK